ncbi:MAG: SDR family oxidoreductase [Oligoflexales bacterium]|nr:SDR family oxidoreductase [Oligoflexales bacterium]
MRMNKKAVLVTGGLGGIGWAICTKLASDGFHVYLTDSQEADLEKRKTEMGSDLQKQMTFYKMDVRSHDSIMEIYLKTLESEHGAPSVIVNNAGVFESCSFLDISEDSFRNLLEVNLLGVFRVSKVFSKSMISKKNGHIINISSIAAHVGVVDAAHYAASKSAVTSLTKSMAIEFSPYKIRVNAIAPGYIDTKMTKQYESKVNFITKMRVPLRRLGRSDEVAEVVFSLIDCEAEYLTGAEITVDGGFSIY